MDINKIIINTNLLKMQGHFVRNNNNISMGKIKTKLSVALPQKVESLL